MVDSSTSYAQVPVGAVVMWAGEVDNSDILPLTWLVCDGKTYQQTDYPALYEAIGLAYSSIEDPAGAFRVPDLRGMFVRGVDSGSQRDPDANNRIDPLARSSIGDFRGSIQYDAIRDHSHQRNGTSETDPGKSFGVVGLSIGEDAVETDDDGLDLSSELIWQVSYVGNPDPEVPIPLPEEFLSSAETRPLNMAMYFVICAGQLQ